MVTITFKQLDGKGNNIKKIWKTAFHLSDHRPGSLLVDVLNKNRVAIGHISINDVLYVDFLN